MGKQLKYHPSLFYGQDDTQCYLCGSGIDIQRHEIFFGRAYRDKSKQYGLWVNLCSKCHYTLHNKDHSIDLKLKQEGQKRFEEVHNGNRNKFMHLFGKNRLEE